MSKILKTALVAVMVMVGMTAWAQAPQRADVSNEPMTVTVVSVSDNVLVVRTDAAEELRLTLAADVMTPERTLRAGDRIRVWKGTDEAQQEVVTRVEMAEVDLTVDTTGVGVEAGVETEVGTEVDPLESDPVTDPVVAETEVERDPLTVETETENDPLVDDETDELETGTYGYRTGEYLPRTASSTPMTALLGLLALGGAFVVRAAVRLM